MAWSWRETGKAIIQRGKHILPLPVSIGLIAFLVWKISPEKLLAAFRQQNWPMLVLATVVQVVALFLWDSVCVWWLFSQPDRRLPFGKALRIRCDTVIWAAINLEVGQAAFAWKISKTLGVPLTNVASYCVLLTLFDSGSLMSLALVGSFIHPTPLTSKLRWICVAILCGLATLAALIKFLPERWRGWLNRRSWGDWIKWFDWRSALTLWGLREIMFLLVLVYAGVCLAICRLAVNASTVVGVIPFVLMAESLPGTGGLGERETALVYLYPDGDNHRATLMCFGLIWSTMVIVGRVCISLISWASPRARDTDEVPQSSPSEDQSLPAADPA